MPVNQREGSPFWQYSFTINGVRFRGSTGCTSKREAELVEAEKRHEARNWRMHKDPWRLRDCFGAYWNEHAKHKRAGMFVFRKLDALSRILGKDILLTDLTNAMLIEYRAKRRENCARKVNILARAGENRGRGVMGFLEADLFGERERHQSQLPPAMNKFHLGNGDDGKHYWLTPPELYAELDAEFAFDFDPCPFPLPEGFDGLTCEWGQSNYVNPPFGSIIHEGRKKGPTAWVRKAIIEWQKGKRVVLVYPVDKWLLMLTAAILGDDAQIRNLGDVKWCATEDGSQGKGTGRHIACFILEPRLAGGT